MMQMSKKIYISLMCFGLHLVTNHDLFVLNHYKTIFLQIDVFSWQQSGAPKPRAFCRTNWQSLFQPKCNTGSGKLISISEPVIFPVEGITAECACTGKSQFRLGHHVFQFLLQWHNFILEVLPPSHCVSAKHVQCGQVQPQTRVSVMTFSHQGVCSMLIEHWY